MIKMLVAQQFPGWVRPLFLGVVGAVVASLALLVGKHVSVSVSFH